MTREELKEHCERRVRQREFYAHERGIDPSGKVYEESKLVLELLEQRPAHDGWHKYPDEKPQDEDLEYIICVSGKIGNIEYDHAVLMGDNYFEDGKWYIHGHRKEGVTVLAWMEPPEPYTDDL